MCALAGRGRDPPLALYPSLTNEVGRRPTIRYNICVALLLAPMRWKLFRKYLPTHESISQNKYIARLGPRIQHHNLWHLNRRSVAGGVAAGLFAGLIPGSNPVQFLAAALLSLGFKVNLPISVVVTLYSNPFTIVPLYYGAFKLGQLVLLQGGNTELPPVTLDLHALGLRQWIPAALDWLANLGKPLLVGIPLLAIALAAIGYIAVDTAWRVRVRMEWRRRRLRRARETSA
jgi:uncharacterized protein (DUF2062 family)